MPIDVVQRRAAGQMGARILTARFLRVDAPPALALHLLPPGVIGVVYALNPVSEVGAGASTLHADVVVGTIGFELVAAHWPARRAGQ